MANVVRVGICACTDLYHGEFSNQTWIIDNLNEKEILPITFRLEEICIPEIHQQTALLSTRCHFFLDQHYRSFLENPYYHTVAFLYDYVPHTKTGIEIPFCGWGLAKGWDTKEPTQTEEIIQAMRYMLMKFDEDDLYGWLMHLTLGIDPRRDDNHQEQFEHFQARAYAKRAKRLEEYHCYPACTDCH